MRSAPSLYATGADMAGIKSVIDTTELTHPLSVELKRWQQFAEFSKQEMKHSVKLTRERPVEEAQAQKSQVHVGGLVNFPKYMLIHNCHLKNQDQMRYVREEAAKREEAEEEMRRRSQLGDVDQGQACDETQVSGQSSPSLKKVASWGQPMRFRTAEDRNSQWAGNPMPQGRGSRTSNPFRTG